GIASNTIHGRLYRRPCHRGGDKPIHLPSTPLLPCRSTRRASGRNNCEVPGNFCEMRTEFPTPNGFLASGLAEPIGSSEKPEDEAEFTDQYQGLMRHYEMRPSH